MQNKVKANDLIKVLEEAKQKVPVELMQLANTVHSFSARGSNKGSRGTFKRGKGAPQDSAKRSRYGESGFDNDLHAPNEYESRW